ncbi:MAG: mechanosensitive ion channel family protein [Bacteroidales bacterium]
MKSTGPILAAIILFTLGISNLAAQNGQPITSPAPDQKEEIQAVLFRGDTLFVIRAMLGPFSPRERVENSERNLATLQKAERIRLDSFRISEIDGYSIVSYMDQAVIHVSDEDAHLAGTTRQELAEKYLTNLRNAFTDLHESRSGIYWVKRIGYTLLTLLGLILIFVVMNRLFRWINKRLSRYEQGIKRKRTSLIRYFLPNQSPNVFLFLSKVVRVLLIILVLFLYLPLLFSFFPQTENLVNRFYQYIADPVKSVGRGLLNFLPNLFYIFVIIVIARYLIRILNMLSSEIEIERLKIKGFHKDWAQPTANIIKIILYAFTLVFIFPYLPGSNSPAFKGVSIFLGVLFSLGSTSAIANIVAGIVITYMRPFMLGDRVKIGESVGDVLEKNLLVTRIRTIKNEEITIPNATIINAHLWNYSKSASSIGIILHTTVTIGYNVSPKKVIGLLLKAAQNTKDLSREFKPFVLQKSLSDFYVEYELNVYTKQPKKMALLRSDLNNSIQEVFNQSNVEIMSPHYSAYRDGNASTVPVSELPDEPDDPEGPEKPKQPKKSKEPEPPKTIVDQVIDKVTGRK